MWSLAFVLVTNIFVTGYASFAVENQSAIFSADCNNTKTNNETNFENGTDSSIHKNELNLSTLEKKIEMLASSFVNLFSDFLGKRLEFPAGYDSGPTKFSIPILILEEDISAIIPDNMKKYKLDDAAQIVTPDKFKLLNVEPASKISKLKREVRNNSSRRNKRKRINSTHSKANRKRKLPTSNSFMKKIDKIISIDDGDNSQDLNSFKTGPGSEEIFKLRKTREKRNSNKGKERNISIKHRRGKMRRKMN